MDGFLSPKAGLGTDIKLGGKDLQETVTDKCFKKNRYITGNFWSSSHPRQPDLQFVELHPMILAAVGANTSRLFLERLSHPLSLERNSCCPWVPQEVSLRALYLSPKHRAVLREVALCSNPQKTCPERCHSAGKRGINAFAEKLHNQAGETKTPRRWRKVSSSPLVSIVNSPGKEWSAREKAAVGPTPAIGHPPPFPRLATFHIGF